MPFEDYTTVEEVMDGDVILVGEEHTPPGAEYSEDLADRVLQEYEPQAVAIERGSARPRRRSGMGAISDYAESESIPLLGVDESSRGWHSLDVDTSGIISDANRFTCPIQEDGDVDPQAIADARERIRENYGEEAYDAMYTDREEGMAQRLRYIVDEYDTPIVVGIGTFHIRALANRLEAGGDQLEVSGRRIRRNATA